MTNSFLLFVWNLAPTSFMSWSLIVLETQPTLNPKLHISGLYIPALKKTHAVGRDLPSQLPARQQMFVFSKSPEQPHGAVTEQRWKLQFSKVSEPRQGGFSVCCSHLKHRASSRDNPGCAAADLLQPLLIFADSDLNFWSRKRRQIHEGFLSQLQERSSPWPTAAL